MNKLELSGTVGEEITVDQVRGFLNANKGKDVQFDISSLGGDLSTAITIHELIKSYPNKTVANVVGLTASAGTVIGIACDEVAMSDNTLWLVHNGWKEQTGNVYDMQKAASDLAKTDAIMIKMYREKTGLPIAEIQNIMKASDWMSPSEAYDYGFVDRVYPSGTKIAASVILSQASGKIDNQLLIKLKERMELFGKKKPVKAVVYALSMKDGKQCLIDAAEPAAGVGIMPVGAMDLEDGTFELTDGRVITVSGGTITGVETPATPEGGEDASAAEVIAAVSALVIAENAKVKAEIMAEVKAELGKIQSKHVPPKGTMTPNAKVDAPDVTSRVKAVTDGIFSEIAKNRQK